MTSLNVPRWAVSFADLTMLLLAFFVLLHADDTRTVSAAAHAAFSDEAPPPLLMAAPAAHLFEPGEARLTARALSDIRAIGKRSAASRQRLIVESEGRELGGRRLDGWELAAARAAAVARALTAGGVAEERVTILMAREGRRDEESVQRLTVRQGG